MDASSGDFKRKLLMGIAAACGGLALLMLYSYMATEKENNLKQVEEMKKQLLAQQQPQQISVAVFVAMREIKQGEQLNSDNVGVREIPQDYVIAGALMANNSNSILGLTALTTIATGEQILQTKIGQPERPKLLSAITPPGKRAVPVSVDNISALSGLLQPGDYVDVMAMIAPPPGSPLYSLAGDVTSGQAVKGKSQVEAKAVSIPLFQNVLVLAVSGATGKEKGGSKNPASDMITLALSPQEAAMISFVQEQGKIKIVMRSNSDVGDASIQVVNWDSLFDYLYPGARARGIRRSTTVEVYRGLEKETVSLPLEGQNK